jgi:hypothetical protein
MEKKVRAFFVWNAAISLIRILSSFKADDQALVFRPVRIFFQGISQGFRAYDE